MADLADKLLFRWCINIQKVMLPKHLEQMHTGTQRWPSEERQRKQYKREKKKKKEKKRKEYKKTELKTGKK